jgi:hypothetical protein
VWTSFGSNQGFKPQSLSHNGSNLTVYMAGARGGLKRGHRWRRQGLNWNPPTIHLSPRGCLTWGIYVIAYNFAEVTDFKFPTCPIPSSFYCGLLVLCSGTTGISEWRVSSLKDMTHGFPELQRALQHGSTRSLLGTKRRCVSSLFFPAARPCASIAF